MSSPATVSRRPRTALRRPPRSAFHGAGRVSSIRLQNLQSSIAHPTTQGPARQHRLSSTTNTAANQLGSQNANAQAQVAPQRRWFSDLGINLSNSIIAFFAFIATMIYGIWTWIQSSIANQIARASGALGLVQYCEQYSDTKNGKVLCSTPVDLNTIVKQFSPPSTDRLSQMGARSEAFNWHESSAIRSHEPRGALIFRVIFYASNFPFQCFELLISALRKGSHKFQRQFRKCATYFAAILTLCTNLPGLWSTKVVQTSIRSITVAQTSFVILFLLRGRVEANSYLAEIENLMIFIGAPYVTVFLAIFLRTAKEPESGSIACSLKQWSLNILPMSWQQFDIESLRPIFHSLYIPQVHSTLAILFLSPDNMLSCNLGIVMQLALLYYIAVLIAFSALRRRWTLGGPLHLGPTTMIATWVCCMFYFGDPAQGNKKPLSSPFLNENSSNIEFQAPCKYRVAETQFQVWPTHYHSLFKTVLLSLVFLSYLAYIPCAFPGFERRIEQETYTAARSIENYKRSNNRLRTKFLSISSSKPPFGLFLKYKILSIASPVLQTCAWGCRLPPWELIWIICTMAYCTVHILASRETAESAWLGAVAKGDTWSLKQTIPLQFLALSLAGFGDF